jgi:hypothetical protein
MPGFRHTGAMSKGCSDADIRQSAEVSVSHTMRIIEVGFDPVSSLRHARLEVLSFYHISLRRIPIFHEVVIYISLYL